MLFYQQKLPNVGCYDECKNESDFSNHIRTTYPGALQLEYQQVIDIFRLHVELGPKETTGKGKGIFTTVLAFAPAHEEQCRRTLHLHWQIWTEDLSPQVREDLWNSHRNICKKSREAFYCNIDEVMTSREAFYHYVDEL